MADLFTFVDIQAQTQTTQKTASSSNNNNSNAEPGFFDSLMKEYTGRETPENSKSENVVSGSNELNKANLNSFNGNKLFSGSVLEILACSKTSENLETLNSSDEFQNLVNSLKNSLGQVKNFKPEGFSDGEEVIFNSEEISQLLNLSDEELNEKLNSLPEDLKAEIKNLIDEINNALENGGDINTLKSSVEKLSGIIVKQENKIKPEDEKISDNESNDTKIKEPESISVENAGLVAAGNVENKTVETDNKAESSEKNFDVKDSKTRQNSKVIIQNHNQNAENEIKADTAKSKPEQNFEKVIEDSGEENSQKVNENEAEPQNSNFGQSRENFSDSRNGSRSRNDGRRISNDDSHSDERDSSTTTHRTESRNDFQSFFDGVLNSRRTSGTSGTYSQPLNLRGNLNLNQSETLRDGLVNVVRFIRTDGVQKASVVVDPPALGRISVELTSSSSGVEASIKVASEQIRQLVQDQLTQLRMNLSEQGVQVAEFTVDVQQDNQQRGNSQNGNQGNGRENFVTGIESDDDTEEFRVDLEEGLLYWVA